MIAGKDLLNQFKAASWKDPDEIDAFIDSVEAPDTSELLKNPRHRLRQDGG